MFGFRFRNVRFSSPIWGIFFIALLIAVPFRGILIGRHAIGESDTLYWFGAFHYFLSHTTWDGFPLWNPYTHGGEPFYFLYSMYRLLDPLVALPLAFAKIFPLSTLYIYQCFVLLKNAIYLLGVWVLLVTLFRSRPLLQYLSLFTFLAFTQFSADGMFKIDTLLWVPWILVTAIWAYHKRSRPALLTSFYLLGIHIGASSYHFLFLVMGYLPLALIFFRKPVFEWAIENKTAFLLGGALVVLLSAPLVSAALTRDKIFPASRAYGNRTEFMDAYTKDGTDVPSYAQAFVIKSDHRGAFPSPKKLLQRMFPYDTLGRFLGTIIFILGFFNRKFAFRWFIASALIWCGLLSVGPATPIHPLLYEAFSPFRIVRHLAGFFDVMEPLRAIVIGFGASLLVDFLAERSRLLIAQALVVILLITAAWTSFTEWAPGKVSVKHITSFVDGSRLYDGIFKVAPALFPEKREAVLPRPSFILNECMILMRSCALTSALPPPVGVGYEQLGVIPFWKKEERVDGNYRVIYWPKAYLPIYFLGEQSGAAFQDIMGIDRPLLQFYPNAQVIQLTQQQTLDTFKQFHSKEQRKRLSDAVLFVEPPVSAPSGDSALSGGTAEVEVKGFGANYLRVDVNAHQTGYLLYRDNWDSSWIARNEGGERLPLVKSNGAFKSVPIELGKQTIEFRYRPSAFVIAVWIYVFANLAFVMILIKGWKKTPASC